MTLNQSDETEVREIVAGVAPTRFARGWHCLGLSESFKDGKPHSVHAFVTKQVVFAASNPAHQLHDANCPPMAGDLTQGADGARSSLLPVLLPVALPIMILIVPLGDLVLAVVRRTRAGRSPFAPDKQHLHHRLLEIGHSHRRAVIIMWLWAGMIAFGVVVASVFTGPIVWSVLAAGLVLTMALTFALPRVNDPGAVEPPMAAPDSGPTGTL